MIPISERQQRVNLFILTVAQALAGANSVVVFATGAILGNTLAPDPTLATLPISIFVVGMAINTLPAGQIAFHYGRRAAFMAGSIAGVASGLVALFAILTRSFQLFCLATFFGGMYAAVVLSFRFAAADGVPPERKARALSLVMIGGIAAGVIGPTLVTWTQDLWSQTFTATFGVQAIIAAFAGILLMGVRLPKPTASEKQAGRPFMEIVSQPLFMAAVLCGAVSYLLMNFLMTSAPLAMHLHGHSLASSNLGLQWHVIAMYAPSFFTGSLISRFGPTKITVLGLILIAASSVIGLGGINLFHFWGMLILLGVGWNFGFLGASAMILNCHQPEESTRVQSLNDFIIFGLMALGSFASGGILSLYGWGTVLWVSLIPLSFTVFALWVVKPK